MLKGFAIVPVVLGRISIGGTVEKNGRRIPIKHDFFTITSNIQKDGKWVEHPVAQKLNINTNGRLLSIPVRIMFDSPDNNFMAKYTAFNDKGRIICTGDGDQAKRLDPKSESGVKDCACPGPERCSFGQDNRCKPYGRLIVGIEEAWQRDPLAGFMLRTTSWNTIRALSARLSYLHAASGGMLAGMPCNLVLRSKSTLASMRQPIYYVDLEPRGDLASAIAEARTVAEAWKQAGIDRYKLDLAVSEGYAASAFVESEDEGEDILAEFYNDQADQPETGKDTDQGNGSTVTPETRDAERVNRAMSELEIKSLKESIARLKNIKDEKGLNDARAWARMRYAAFPEAVRQLEEAIDRRGAEIRGEFEAKAIQSA